MHVWVRTEIFTDPESDFVKTVDVEVFADYDPSAWEQITDTGWVMQGVSGNTFFLDYRKVQ